MPELSPATAPVLSQALLTLARGQAGLDRREPFDLATVTREAPAGRHTEAERRELVVHTVFDPAPAIGHPRLAEHLVAKPRGQRHPPQHPGWPDRRPHVRRTGGPS